MHTTKALCSIWHIPHVGIPALSLPHGHSVIKQLKRNKSSSLPPVPSQPYGHPESHLPLRSVVLWSPPFACGALIPRPRARNSIRPWSDLQHNVRWIQSINTGLICIVTSFLFPSTSPKCITSMAPAKSPWADAAPGWRKWRAQKGKLL